MATDFDMSHGAPCSTEVQTSIETFPSNTMETSSDFYEYDSNIPWPFRVIARHPRLSLVITFVLQLFVWIVTIGLVAAGKDVLPVKFDVLPIQIYDSVWYERALATTSARLELGISESTNWRWHRTLSSDWIKRVRIDLMYGYEGNILTADPMDAIRQFERKISSYPEAEKYYQFISFFHMVPKEVTVLSNPIVKSLINMALKNKTTAAYFPFVFPPHFKHHRDLYSESRMIRSVMVPVSWKAYTSEASKRFRYGPLQSILSNQGEAGTVGSGVSFSYWSLELYQLAVSNQGLKDSLFAIGSFLFILLVIYLHTRSAALTAASLFGILTALLSANLIYRYAVGHRYIGVFHAISIFLLLGIGADDVFVLFDAWRDSFQTERLSDAQRLSFVLRRAGAATFITSLTSSLAFLVNASCRVLLVSTFGIFTGIAVLVNYFIAITFLPIVFLNIHIACGNSSRPCCRPNWSEEKRRVAKFFEKTVFHFLNIRTVAIVSLVVCGIMSVIFIWQSALLVPSASILQQMFRPGSNFYRAEKMASRMKHNSPAEIAIVFGIGYPDRSACTRDDFKCYGEPVWLDHFDINPPKAQQSLLKLCRRLRTDLALREPLNLLPHPQNSSENYIHCFLDDMERDMNLPKFQVCPNDSSGPPLDLRIPINRQKVERLVQCYPQLFANGSSALSPNFSRYYEAALSWWLQESNSTRANYTSRNVIMTYEGGAPELDQYGGRMRLAVISAFTKFTSHSDSFFTGVPIRENWEAFASREIAALPTAALRKGFQCTQASSTQSPLNYWEWFSIQEALWNNARTGLLVGLLGVALPVLFFATRNVVLTLAGVICLSFAIGGVVMMANAFGWSLGVSESINFALVTGLSVDYVVHFIEAYHQAGWDIAGREERVRHMLVRVGGAVSSGVITTLGAIMFLFGSKLIIFIQFGVFLGSAILFAFLAAIFLMTPFLLLAGPQGDFASLDPLLRRAWRRISSFGRR